MSNPKQKERTMKLIELTEGKLYDVAMEKEEEELIDAAETTFGKMDTDDQLVKNIIKLVLKAQKKETNIFSIRLSYENEYLFFLAKNQSELKSILAEVPDIDEEEGEEEEEEGEGEEGEEEGDS